MTRRQEFEPPRLTRFFNAMRYDRRNDRASALVIASHLEAVLEALLRARLIQTDRVDDLFRGRGPLGSFASMIDIAHALGLTNQEEARQLHLVRKVRNHFAHTLGGASFNASPVRQWCAELELFRHPRIAVSRSSHSRERRAFFVTGLMLGTILEMMVGSVPRVRHHRRPAVFPFGG